MRKEKLFGFRCGHSLLKVFFLSAQFLPVAIISLQILSALLSLFFLECCWHEPAFCRGLNVAVLGSGTAESCPFYGKTCPQQPSEGLLAP